MYKIIVRKGGLIKMIKTVESTTLRNHLADVISEVSQKKDYMLITKKNKPISAIVNLDFFEDLLALSSKEYLESIKKAREDYKHGKVCSHEEVFGKI